MIFIAILLGLLILVLYLMDQSGESDIEIDLGVEIFDLEIAKTPEEISEGLMYRRKLSENKGMIFIFEDEKKRSFWMKNTFIPLDMIFMDSTGKIVEIKENILPCETQICKSYISLPAKYVIEINSGRSYDLGLEVENVIDLKNL